MKTKKKVFTPSDVQFSPKILTAGFATWFGGPTSRDGAFLYVRPSPPVGGVSFGTGSSIPHVGGFTPFNVDLEPTAKFSSFEEITLDEVQLLLKMSSNKCSSLDSIPTWFLKKVAHPILPLCLAIVNKSFCESVFLTLFKRARAVPLSKGENVSKEKLKRY